MMNLAKNRNYTLKLGIILFLCFTLVKFFALCFDAMIVQKPKDNEIINSYFYIIAAVLYLGGTLFYTHKLVNRRDYSSKRSDIVLAVVLGLFICNLFMIAGQSICELRNMPVRKISESVFSLIPIVNFVASIILYIKTDIRKKQIALFVLDGFAAINTAALIVNMLFTAGAK